MSNSGSARELGFHAVHYIRRRMQYSDVGFTSGIKIGRLPKGAFIKRIQWHKATAFNSTSTDTVKIGVSAGDNTILAATDVHSTGHVDHTSAAGLGKVVATTADADVYVTWTSGGGTPTTGDCTVIIEYVPDNDQ